MSKHQAPPAIPDPVWGIPASNWTQAIERYTTFLQVPTWRASLKRGGHDKASCLSSLDAELLRRQMLAVLVRVAGGRRLTAKPSSNDLAELWRRSGRSTPRSQRCPSKLQVHFQRALLLNAGGYRCPYCRRTAWGVYAEQCDTEPPRTLRFEVDHRITRQRLEDRERFDARNLVAACRSCNVVKAEMPVDRFTCELESLSRAVQDGRGHNRPTTV
jgi:5-methylcytosine-specific restriction endonuclease McrA